MNSRFFATMSVAALCLGMGIATASAQVVAERGGYAAQPILMPSPVSNVSAAPVVFRNDHQTPIGYNVTTAVPLAGAVVTGAAHPAAYAGAAYPAPVNYAGTTPVGFAPTVTGIGGGSGQLLPSPMVGPAQGVQIGIGAVSHAATAQPVVFHNGMTATTVSGGHATAVPINAFGSAVTSGGSVSPGIQHAPIVSVVSMPTTVMTQRLVMPVRRP